MQEETSRIVQIYHLTNTDSEQVAWCLDINSQTVCIRTPLIFSVLVEALSVENARGVLTERSKNIPVTKEIFRNFLNERKVTLRGLSIDHVEEVRLHDIYFYQDKSTKPYLRVFFSNLRGFSKFKRIFQGQDEEEEDFQEDIPNDDEHECQVPESLLINKKHCNVHLISEGIFAHFRILESDIPPYWHWLIHHGIRAASTVIIPPDAEIVEEEDPMRLSLAKREYRGVTRLTLSPGGDISTHPKILSWDIEALSENPSRFPNAYALGDVAFFISAYIRRYNDPEGPSRRVGIYLVDSIETLGLKTNRLEDGTELIIVDTEEKLLDAFWNLIREEKPQILLGYNTMGFDTRYLHHRMSIYDKHYPNMSLMTDANCKSTGVRQFTWSSSAYKAVECWYYDAPGMIVLDLFVELKRSESLKAYTLDAVSEHFLNEHKVDLKAREMFNIYIEYQNGVRNSRTQAEMRRIAEYGIQDSVLPVRLFDLRTQWVTYTQMASIMGVGIMDLITRGQTLRTKSNIYRMCRQLGFVINVPRDKPTFNGKFRGAYVCDMNTGLHNNVIVYDFASLYPSTIAAYNLCYSTFIHPRDWSNYAEDKYISFNVTSGQDTTIEVRYIKSTVFKGILPRVVEGFLKARQDTKNDLKKEKDPVMRGILDKKQLAIKVSNNSVYGAVGSDFSGKEGTKATDVCASALGLKWIAMTVTEIGQILIKGCTKFLKDKYSATPIYGDTDSTFVMIPPLLPGEKCTLWEKAARIADEFNATLPPPLKIELEKIIRMVGLTAKRYLYRCYTPDGKLKKDLNFKGVVATRRDTCKWQVKLFSSVAEAILQDLGKDTVTEIVYREILDLMRGRVPMKHLLIGCSVAESYKSDSFRMAILKRRMASLGRPIAGGSRVEFLIIQTEVPENPTFGAKVSYKSPYTRGPKGGIREDSVSSRVRMADEYVEGETKIDYPYYIAHLAQNSVDQLFAAAYHGDRVIGPLVKGLRFNPEKTLSQIEFILNESRTH